MLDVPGGVSPPNQQDDATHKGEEKQESQRIESVRLAVPVMSLADHRLRPLYASARRTRTPYKKRARSRRELELAPWGDQALCPRPWTRTPRRAASGQPPFEARDPRPQIAVLELRVDYGGVLGEAPEHGPLIGV